ncbi:MAG: AzlD domain-containing protein [Rhizobiaceae bacterium]|nr:AzlD domain-containing protein [Rhizobiaceae bacterium]MCV0405218.1 AzlD domain-containing protein [Rhizobiaceae bacterium]
MTYGAIDAWWWPYLFILVAGWLATDFWRYLGVYLGGKVAEESEAMVLVRCIATALVAAVIASLVVYPGGALADTPLALRIGAMAAGFAAYMLVRRNVLLSIVVTEIVLIGGLAILQR